MQKIKLKKFFYNNKWHIPKSNAFFVNQTSNGSIIKIPNCNKQDVEISISAAVKAQNSFSNFTNKKKIRNFK